MAARGRIYRRGLNYYIAYRWDGREYRESARSTDVGVAERLLATRVAERRGHGHAGVLTFDDLVAWYLDDYEVRRLRTLNTARGRVANLRATFGERPATAITPDAIRAYQRTRRAAGAAAATVNRETSALSRMLHLAVRSGASPSGRCFPSGWRSAGLGRAFSNTRTIWPSAGTCRRPIRTSWTLPTTRAGGSARFWSCGGARWMNLAASFGCRLNVPRRGWGGCCRSWRRLRRCWRALRQGEDPLVFRRDAVTVRAWRTAWPEACRRAAGPGRLLHDCRRTAARNLVRAGVPERVAMQLTGHRSRAIFDRYYIVREDELHEAGAQLVAYVAAQADPPPLARMDPVVSKNSNGPDGTRGREWRPARASPRSPPDGTERAHRAASSPRPAGADGR